MTEEVAIKFAPSSANQTVSFDFHTLNVVPEPTSLTLAIVGLAGLGAFYGVRRRQGRSPDTQSSSTLP